MALFDYIKLTVLLFALPLVGLAQNTSTPSNQNMTMIRNLTSCNSDLRIDELAVEDILRHAQSYSTHVVEITVSVNSGNKTRELKWSWANEIGRTIISFKALVYRVNILNAGVKEVNVVVENHGCLPNGSNGSEIIFDFLLHKIFRSDDIQDYKLCHLNHDTIQLNCCRIASGGNQPICAEYFSVLLYYVANYIAYMICVMLFFGCPVIVQYLRSLPKEKQYYSITDSPMALSRIFYVAFLEGSNNPSTPYYRRLTFSLTVVAIFFINAAGLTWFIISIIWALLFFAYDWLALNGGATTNIESYLTILTLPLNVKYWWKYFKELTEKEQTEQSTSPQDDPNRQSSHEEYTKISCRKLICEIIKQSFKALVFVILYIFCFALICLFSPIFPLCILFVFGCKRLADSDQPRKCVCVILFLYVIVLLVWIGFLMLFFFQLSILLLSLIIGLYLNGSYFSPTLLSIGILVLYSWKNWTSLVETKHLQLKTAIYECCEEYYKEKKKGSDTSTPTTSSPITEKNDKESEESTESMSAGYSVNVKEGTVSKALYHKIREHKLPCNEVFFYFSMRMIFVANFCLIVFVMMSLAQNSNTTELVKIVSKIAVSTFPLIFNMIWGDHSFEQKNLNLKKLKKEINSIITMEIKRDGIVAVQLTCEEKITKVEDSLRDILGMVDSNN